MQVVDIMSAPAIAVEQDATLAHAISLMLTHKVSGLPVVDDIGQLCGVLSEGDLLRRAELGTSASPRSWWASLFSSGDPAKAYRLANGRKVSDVMCAEPITIEPTADLSAAVELMERHKIKRLPVMDGSTLVGVVSRADFMRALRGLISGTATDTGPAIPDASIRTAIEAEIAAQRWADRCNVDVLVEGGHVFLFGKVATEAQRRAAIVAAENALGTRAVTSEILVVERQALVEQ